jgi:hypothetical protein
MERPKYQPDYVLALLSVQIEGGAQNPDREVRQMRSIVVELYPADHAVVLQILRDFRFAYAQMLGEFRFKAAVEGRAPAANGFGGAAPAAAREISQADAQRLASLNVVGSYLVGIREQENARTGRSRIRFIQAVQRAGDQAAQHGFEFGHARSQGRIAGAAVRGAFRRKHWSGLLNARVVLRFLRGSGCLGNAFIRFRVRSRPGRLKARGRRSCLRRDG